jgi:hypothetical protein
MATVTPNYNWPVPTSTDFVKDGAASIEALGDAIDATVFGLPSGGLTLINATSFSAVASQSINNVFTSTYQNYEIRLNVTAKSTLGGINLRYRASGADNTTTNYNKAADSVRTNNTVVGDGSTGQTSISNFGVSNADSVSVLAHVFNPQAAFNTTALHQFFGNDATSQFVYHGGSIFNGSDVFDGFTIFPATGTITGTVYVYGLAK